jgi:hypothetical protein
VTHPKRPRDPNQLAKSMGAELGHSHNQNSPLTKKPRPEGGSRRGEDFAIGAYRERQMRSYHWACWEQCWINDLS